MKKLSLKRLGLNANDLLQREQLKGVFGGYAGNWWCSCNSGANIGAVPSCTTSNCDWACANQGGWSGACGCAGYGC